MTHPALQSVHIDFALNNLSTAFIQDAQGFVADKVFPRVPVGHVSNDFFQYNLEDFFQNGNTKYSPGQDVNRLGFNLSTGHYKVDVYPVETPIYDMTTQNADEALNIDMAAMQVVTQSSLIKRETDWVTNFFTTGKWATDVVGGVNFTKWDDPASDPQKDVQNGMLAVLKATGKLPNKLVITLSVLYALQRHPMIREQYKFTSSESITVEMIARFFNLPAGGLLVTYALQNTAQPGLAASLDFIAGKNALLCYAAPAPGLMTPSAGYIFVWNSTFGSFDVVMERYRDNPKKCDIARAWMNYDQKLVSTLLGYFFSNAVS